MLPFVYGIKWHKYKIGYRYYLIVIGVSKRLMIHLVCNEICVYGHSSWLVWLESMLICVRTIGPKLLCAEYILIIDDVYTFLFKWVTVHSIASYDRLCIAKLTSFLLTCRWSFGPLSIVSKNKNKRWPKFGTGLTQIADPMILDPSATSIISCGCWIVGYTGGRWQRV